MKKCFYPGWSASFQEHVTSSDRLGCTGILEVRKSVPLAISRVGRVFLVIAQGSLVFKSLRLELPTVRKMVRSGSVTLVASEDTLGFHEILGRLRVRGWRSTNRHP